MRHAVRAIIIHQDKLLVLHRNKFGQEYDTLPGGNIELGETAEQALVREVDEETTIVFKNPKLVFIEHAGVPYGTQHIYNCEYVSGEPVLKPGSEEDHINKLGQNLYRPEWVSLKDLENRPFLSAPLKRAIIGAYREGFPVTAQEIRV